MTDPFVVHEDSRDNSRLRDTLKVRWVENVAPAAHREIAYLKPSLKGQRVRGGLIFVYCLLFLLVARSAQLQIVDYREYRTAAERNRLRVVRIPAARGAIVDRQGTALTQNVPRFQLVLNPFDLPINPATRQTLLERLSTIVSVPLATLQSATKPKPVFTPLILKTNLTLDEVYQYLIQLRDIPAVTLETISARQYVAGASTAHLIGYLGKIEPERTDWYLSRGYYLNDTVGKSGLEAAFEELLRGKHGRKYVEVNAQGRVQNVEAQEEAVAGPTLTLTLDIELQTKAADILSVALKAQHKERGAVIVLDPRDGALLALVSSPTFDNNLFTLDTKNQDAIQALFSDQSQPLFPRAIAGTYPSGSVIKPAVAALALDAGVITKNTSVLSVGGLSVGEWFFPDWKPEGHGLTNVTKALAESVNTFFYTVGGGYKERAGLGIEKLSQGLKQFGFGRVTGIELTGEVDGLIPDPQWKQENKGEPWYIGDTYHLAIGQGDILVTPLQIARMTAYLASGGKWVRPHLVDDPHLISPLDKGEKEGVGPQIDPNHIQTVRQGLREAVLYGSARALQALPITSAGKTGTAQWSKTKSPHAWFTGFAPYDDPQVVVTVLVEEGGEGSAVAVPIAKEILRWYYQNR